jgi:hypothetical protein
LQIEHTATLERLSQIQGDAGAERAQAKAQADARERLIALLEERNEEAVKRVREVEGEYENVLERAERREHKLEAERDKAAARVEELEGVVRGFVAGEFAPGADVSISIGNASASFASGGGVPGTPGTPSRPAAPGTPRNFGTPNPFGQGTPNPFATPSLLSPTAQLASRTQRGGKSYTEVYSDYVRMSDELGKQKLETRRLEECLAGILRDIEERVSTSHTWAVAGSVELTRNLVCRPHCWRSNALNTSVCSKLRLTLRSSLLILWRHRKVCVRWRANGIPVDERQVYPMHILVIAVMLTQN